MSRPYIYCLHCGLLRRIYSRGLCSVCWHDPKILARYPTYHGSSWNSKNFSRPASDPTEAPPASSEKVKVMMERVERGESLFHPEDVAFNLDGQLVPADEARKQLVGVRNRPKGIRVSKMSL